ncbi:MAG: glycosyltransferase family 4 protein [Bacteroidales bacterium]|jgi:glycosyltransferase involved in cell wall biosynthesis
MKVLLINRNDFVDGGADRVFLNTFDLLQVAGCGLQVEKFTREDVGMETIVDPRSLSVWKKLLHVRDYLYNRRVAGCLDRKIQVFRPDVAHVHLFYGTLSTSILKVLKKKKVPVVLTVHDYRLLCPANAMLDRHGHICEKCYRTKYYQCFIKRCSGGNLFFSTVIMLEAYLRKWMYKPIKLIDRFIFVSDFSRNKHIEFDPRYMAKSIRLYNMADEKPGIIPIKGDYLLFYGRISKEKGLLTLIEAVKNIQVKLIIAGRGPQEEEIKRLIDYKTIRPATNNPQPATRNQQPATSTIDFAGFLSGSELGQLILGCSFVVVPSEWYENNPMTVVEAFALGKPVIGSRIGGIPELVTSETGFLFEPGNPLSLAEAIEKAVNLSTEKYKMMSVSCREFANMNFDRRKHLEQLTGIYQQVVN